MSLVGWGILARKPSILASGLDHLTLRVLMLGGGGGGGWGDFKRKNPANVLVPKQNLCTPPLPKNKIHIHWAPDIHQ